LQKPKLRQEIKSKWCSGGQVKKTLGNSYELRKEYASALNEKPKGRINYARKHNLETTLSDDLALIPVGDYLSKAVEEGLELITF